ncbi:MAG: hypothetical protein JWQ30_848, partial [Sediminibacterium sp.]|nr:hypothetical protein [Sediminibacterium sp.]
IQSADEIRKGFECLDDNKKDLFLLLDNFLKTDI